MSSLTALGLRVRGDARAWAAFSPCRRYRYALGRSWAGADTHAVALFVLHNPSTADHEVDDPTLRKCVSFAKREGCNGVVVVNVFAYRSTDKGVLGRVDDPVGPMNARVLRLAGACADRIVVAWGCIDRSLAHHTDAAGSAISASAQAQRVTCLGVNGDGSPKHPLYLRRNTPLNAW
jgi:hypothetical protein